MPYEPTDEVKDVVSSILARVGIGLAQGDESVIEATFDDIDRLEADAVLELFKATILLASTLALKSFTAERGI